MEVQCCGDRLYANELAQNLTKVIEDLQVRFPKFVHHLKNLKGIYVHDRFSDTDFTESKSAMGIYRSGYREIHISVYHAYTYELAIYTLFHEIGHHLVNMKMGIDNYYSSTSKNRAYYKEEIRAEKYALFIIDKFFVKDYPIMFRFLSIFNNFHRIKSSIISTIKKYKSEFEKCAIPIPRYYYTPTTVVGTITSSISYSYTTVRTFTTGTGSYNNGSFANGTGSNIRSLYNKI